MDTIIETNLPVESVRQAYDGVRSEPKPEWVRGDCPECDNKGIKSPLVSNCYYVGNKAYLVCWECWSSLGPSPSCSYRKVL